MDGIYGTGKKINRSRRKKAYVLNDFFLKPT